MSKKYQFILLLLVTGQLTYAQNKQDVLQIPDTITPQGQICFALYTVHDRILKMTAQLYPTGANQPSLVQLELKQDGKWTEVASSDLIYPGFTAHFRIENWDDSREVEYRVVHDKTAYYPGIIRKNPASDDTITVAAFTGNSIYQVHGGDISRQDIVDNLKKVQPDLLFFSGDQVYDHTQHYLYWLKFGRDFGDIIRNTPTICIPDDHDVGMPNLWGAGGKKAYRSDGSDGGYFRPVGYVQEVERAQTSNLPDPYDPTPVERGIGVYYTGLTWGGISFAILEDRKFKSGPAGLVEHHGPRPDHIDYPDYDPADLDVPGAVLLGDRQLDFLRNWTTDWKDAEMKCVLSQTIFCQVASYYGKYKSRIYADFDANGWPQTGRNKALGEIRKSFSLMLAGDQHLGTIVHHGIDEHNDAGYSFCVPSIANLYTRWWVPEERGNNWIKGMPEYTGEYLDGFANKITVYAAANPDSEDPEEGNKLTTRAAGFGIVKFVKPSREIIMECWPRNVDITDPQSLQYPGWPKTIRQADNYGRVAAAYLPVLKVSKPDQLVQVIHQSDQQLVYALRIKGTEFSPKVFNEDLHTIIVGEGDDILRFPNLQPLKKAGRKKMEVAF